MHYDSIKDDLGKVFNRNPFLRKCFYGLLDLLLLRAWHIKKELRKISKTLPKDAMILDAGTGFGQYTYYLSKLGNYWQIKAIDLKLSQINDCNCFFEQIGRSARVRFELANMTTFCEADKYNLAIAIDVMEHISDDTTVFKNLYNSLKTGGILLISTPSDTDNNHHSSFVDEHVRDGYNADELCSKLSTAGFEEIDVRYTYGHPGQISWLLSMKLPLQMLNVSKIFFIFLPLYYLITFPLCMALNLWDVNAKHKTGTGLMVKTKKT